MVKPIHRFSRRASILLILFFLSMVAGLLALKILPYGMIMQKISEKVTALMGEIYRGIIFGLNPGEPVNNESNLPSVTLAPSAAIPATGPLKQSTLNKRYFTDPSGKIVYLTGSHTWSNLQDNGGSNPPPAFNYTAYLDFLQANNHNFFRLWTWEQTRWTVETSDNNYWFSPIPYQRTGPGAALDGQPKFDLTKFNQAYFDRMRSRIIAARDRGIYVSIMLFDGWSIDKNKGPALNDPWKGHPFNKSNNINGINGDPNNDDRGKEVHTLAVTAITNAQKAYIAKVIDTVNDLDNVLYEISNESYDESTQWQYEIINFIHTYELANNRERHPVGMTWQNPDGNNDALYNSPADWISPKFPDGLSNPPVVSADTNKVILPDTDHMGGVVGASVPDFIWKSLTRGHNPIYMDPYDSAQYGVGAAGFNPADASFVLARKNLGYARTYAQRIRLENAIPSTTICSTGYCLVNSSPGAPKYLVYAPNGGSFTVELPGPPIEFIQEWFDPATGEIKFGAKVTGGGTKQFTPPINGSAILYLHPFQDPNATHNYLPVVPKSSFQPMIPLSPAPQGSYKMPDQE